MEVQKKEAVLQLSDPGRILRDVIRKMETKMKYFRLPAGEYPDFVEITVHYPEVRAMIRIAIKEQEESK